MPGRISDRFGGWVLFGPDASFRIEAILPLTLPSGRKVEVQWRLTGFEEWKGVTPTLSRIWNSKRYLNHNGKPCSLNS